ncbi:hypothetical protein M434DRAFT_273520 [Hypoxylon sp. CO27-5]|nr:hypothetical protein M434DRAFT_273520 [Hypoxylon sp. CO27-5]
MANIYLSPRAASFRTSNFVPKTRTAYIRRDSRRASVTLGIFLMSNTWVCLHYLIVLDHPV